MKINVLWIMCLLATSTLGRCSDPNLSAAVPEFQIAQSSRVNALLRFGEAHNLCFGIEYVDVALLTEPAHIRVSGGTVEEAIKTILGHDQPYSVQVHEKVIEISQVASEPDAKNIFDYVLPDFESRRGSMQEVSNLLSMQLVLDLIAPKVTGFAGNFSPGDTSDEVGPFSEHNRTLRSLLTAIISQTKGGAWISGIAWKSRGDFRIPQKRQIWTFVEYGVPSAGYVGILENIATELELEKDSPPTTH